LNSATDYLPQDVAGYGPLRQFQKVFRGLWNDWVIADTSSRNTFWELAQRAVSSDVPEGK